MGILNTLKSALGLEPRLTLVPQEPLKLSRAARQQLDGLAAGRALHVATVPVDGGRAVRVWEGTDEVPDGEPPKKLVLSDDDEAHLHGLTLDFDGARWRVTTTLNAWAKETPNPNSRQYRTDRTWIEGGTAFFTKGEAAPPLGERLLAIPGVSSVLLRDTTLTIDREGDVDWDSIDRAVDATLREYLLLCGKPLSAADLHTSSDPLEQDVLAVLQESLIPYVHGHGGDIQLVSAHDGIVRVRLTGSCQSCPASQLTLKGGVERQLREALPGRIVRVEAV